MANTERPLSPHLSVYRWQISNTLSIFHRMTGFVLALGAIELVAWLVSIAIGGDAYRWVYAQYASWYGQILLAGISFCFFYHCCNGIRHLFWDIGKGFEKDRARQSGILVIIVALILTAGLWAVVAS